jgi:large conductance mechanosensitive channel
MLKEFREFILRGNPVDLAVAVVIGTAFTAVVTSLVEDLITPLIGTFVGKRDFSGLSFTVNESEFRYGNFINALLTFLLVATVLFFFVVKPVNALLSRSERSRRGQGDPPVPGVPERNPDGRAAMRVLHDAGGGGALIELLDRLFDLGSSGLEADVGQAPGSARGHPRRRVRAGRVGDDELEPAFAVAQGVHLRGQRRERVGVREVDGEKAVIARGPAQRTAVGPACGHPDRNVRALHRARLEATVPVGEQAVETVVEQPSTDLEVALLAEALGVELTRALAAEADAEDQPAAAEAIECHGLAGELMRSPTGDRGDHGADRHSLCLHGYRGERDPRVGKSLDRLAIGDVVPDEEAVPATPLGLGRKLGDEGGLGQLLEGSDIDAATSSPGRHSLGMMIQRAI